jgi:uncharacterized membrane protein
VLASLPGTLVTNAGEIETAVIQGVQWLRLAIDGAGAVVLGGGAVIAMASLVLTSLRRTAPDFTAVRLDLARYLALALELQLGADILSTAIAPSWDQIGKLGAIAAIRTSLNYFLVQELVAAGEMPARETPR